MSQYVQDVFRKCAANSDKTPDRNTITPNDNVKIMSTSGYTCCGRHGLWLIMSLKSAVHLSGVGN